MTKNYSIVKNNALSFTARFGFITQDIFFRYLCPFKKTQQYVFWTRLQSDRLITSSRSFADVYYLTNTGRRVLGGMAAPARSIYHVRHDAEVAKFLLEISRSGLVEHTWIDYELSAKPWETYSILGVDRIDKVPDLIVDMKAPSGHLRVALEVERSRKADSRYDQIALSYLALKNVNLILFECNNKCTADAVERAFDADVFRTNDKTPGIFLTEDFDKNGLDTEARFSGRRIKLKRFFSAALKLTDIDWSNGISFSRNRFREKSKDLEVS